MGHIRRVTFAKIAHENVVGKMMVILLRLQCVDTLRLRKNSIFTCIFLKENIWISIVIQSNLLLRVQLTIYQHWFIWWLDPEHPTNHYLNQWWSRLRKHICITQPQWESWPITAINRVKYIRLCKLNHADNWGFVRPMSHLKMLLFLQLSSFHQQIMVVLLP